MNHNTSDMVLQDSDMFSVSNEPPFKEIELMRELVLEIGCAINDRMKEDTTMMGAKAGISSAKKVAERGSPRNN